ncbi:MAG: class II aldolase/adducin family protein [Candidatus Heimdallarchaeum aukensis]|uniref:Class II aldolase/adducin family protein n=1 Tax=Candidatus Heimdallarchaeum aukensis TaxID=2876573 RepID=A0A9Y1FLD8_9ARCH|nr:MAG: class II aldolase/adducin family protein [Candidatus Heimdallarchaeum aukensis]
MGYTEEYVGVKFRHVKEGELEFNSSLNEIALQLQKALSELPPETLEGVTGNISARLSDGILISATRSKLKNLMVPQDLSKVVENTLGGDIIRYYGSKIPSSETPMHLQVYQNRPDVRYCLHLHLPNLEKLQLLNRFPITKESYPYGTWELAREATKALGSNDFVILRDHGILAVGNNLDDIVQKIISISKI